MPGHKLFRYEPLVASLAETRAEAREAGAEEVLFELARAWLRAKRPRESLAVLGRLAKGFPDWAGVAHLGMAEIHLERKEDDAALAALETDMGWDISSTSGAPPVVSWASSEPSLS